MEVREDERERRNVIGTGNGRKGGYRWHWECKEGKILVVRNVRK